jgi:hypothetical protein
VSSTTKKDLTVTDIKKGQNTTLTPDKNTVIKSYTTGKTTSIKITAVNTDDLVIYVNDISGTPALLRSVFDIGKPQG